MIELHETCFCGFDEPRKAERKLFLECRNAWELRSNNSVIWVSISIDFRSHKVSNRFQVFFFWKHVRNDKLLNCLKLTLRISTIRFSRFSISSVLDSSMFSWLNKSRNESSSKMICLNQSSYAKKTSKKCVHADKTTFKRRGILESKVLPWWVMMKRCSSWTVDSILWADRSLSSIKYSP